jgi:hypothetical protein
VSRGGDSGPVSNAAVEFESRRALHELLETVAEIDRIHLAADRGLEAPADVATGVRFLLHLLGGGLDLALDVDPGWPEFRPTLSAGRRFYGDNPDAIYQSTTIDPTRDYRIRANTQGAVFTSFTVEGGGGLDERYPPGRVVSSLNDTRMGISPDGHYELVASVTPVDAPGIAWLPLAPDACSIVTRHYFENAAALDRRISIPIEIEPIDPRSALQSIRESAARDDHAVARGIRRVANFVRGLSLDYARNGPAIDFASSEPNRFGPPSGWSGEPGQGPVDQSNLWAPFELGEGEALVIEGRFPPCRFANLVVWNRHLQSLGRPGTRASLNRRQTRLEADGRFRIVVAHEDPGLPNWLDTGGEKKGVVFVRYLLPEERPEGLEARVVRLSALA